MNLMTYRPAVTYLVIFLLGSQPVLSQRPPTSRPAPARRAPPTRLSSASSSAINPPYTYEIVASEGGTLDGQNIQSIVDYAMNRTPGDIFVLATTAPGQTLALFKNKKRVDLPAGIITGNPRLQVNDRGDFLFWGFPQSEGAAKGLLVFNGTVLLKVGQTFNGVRVDGFNNFTLGQDGTVRLIAEYNVPPGVTIAPPKGFFDNKGTAIIKDSIIAGCTIQTVSDRFLSVSSSGHALFLAGAACADFPRVQPIARLFVTPATAVPVTNPYKPCGQGFILPDDKVICDDTVDGAPIPLVSQDRDKIVAVAQVGAHAAYTAKDSILDEQGHLILPREFRFGEFKLHDEDRTIKQVPALTVQIAPKITLPVVPHIQETKAGLFFYAAGNLYYHRQNQDALDERNTGIFTPNGPVIYSLQPITNLGDFRLLDSFYANDRGQVLTRLFYYNRGAFGPQGKYLIMATPAHSPSPQQADPIMVDPVTLPSDVVPTARVLSKPAELIKDGRKIVGVAADGVARAVLVIPTANAGETVTVSICGDRNETTCGRHEFDDHGGLARLEDLEGNLTSPSSPKLNQTLNTISQRVSSSDSGAFVVYRAPLDFVRSVEKIPFAAGSRSASGAANCPAGYRQDDCAATYRSVFLKLAFNGKEVVKWFEVKIVRPPVTLIHGFTSTPGSWSEFRPVVGPRTKYSVIRLDYHHFVDIDKNERTGRPDMEPLYDSVGFSINSNVLGVRWNALQLLRQLRRQLDEFRDGTKRFIPENDDGSKCVLAAETLQIDSQVVNGRTEVTGTPPDCDVRPQLYPVAATKVDVVGHSMGGLIAKGMWRWGGTGFSNTANFHQGLFNKVITIGTPHLGSQYAYRLMDTTNECVRAKAGNFSFFVHPDVANLAIRWVRINTQQYSGGAWDLRGYDKDHISETLQELMQKPAESWPRMQVSMIAGIATAKNLDCISLNAPTWAEFGAETLCGQQTSVREIKAGDFLADNYSTGGWPKIFGGSYEVPNNDGFVSVLSALNGKTDGPGRATFSGVAHGIGTINELGFCGPNLQDDPRVGARVDQLLNISSKDDKQFTTFPN